jgi:hypothetical protein
MKQKLIFALLLSFSLFFYNAQAQSDQSQNGTQPEIQMDQFDQFSDLFEGLNLGNGMFMDTMIMRQFGGSGMGNAELDQMMQQMMEMMQMQMSQFDFESMDLNQLFEGFELDDMQFYDLDQDPAKPGDQKEGTDKLKKQKKQKTYKL